MSKSCCIPRYFIDPSHIPSHLLLFKIYPDTSLNSCIIRNVSLADCASSTKIVVSSAYCVNKWVPPSDTSFKREVNPLFIIQLVALLYEIEYR